MNICLNGYNSYLPDHFEVEQASEHFNTKFVSGKLTVDKSSEFFPSRSDEKIMRDDIKVGIVSVREMLIKSGLSEEALAATALMVANGAFVEDTQKYMSKIPGMYKNIPEGLNEEEKVYKLYRVSPPLLALETLTNSSMSFIAQYTGIKDHNATFGNTSMAGFYALQEAKLVLESGKNEHVVVSASNCGGGYSFLSNSAVAGFAEEWKESAGGGSVLLSRSPEQAVCKITQMSAGKNVPHLHTQDVLRNWKDLIPDSNADLVLFSGAFDTVQYEEDVNYCNTHFNKSDSLFPEYGNLGASNMILNLIEGIQALKNGASIVDLLDRDVYGRESHLRIEAC